MPFNTLIYLYLFLPLVLFYFYISGENIRKVVILLASLVFSAWFQISLTLVLVASVCVNYVAGLALWKIRNEPVRKWVFVAAVIVNLALLFIFKYLGFSAQALSGINDWFGFKPFVFKDLVLPVGISFYTFKALSYLISVKRFEIETRPNFLVVANYIALFPQLIAGPIDRYVTLSPQLRAPAVSSERFASGIKRFIVGLAKKVLIATPLALVADKIFNSPASQLNAPLAWIGACFYLLQIYYDFSGYTDMAIGTGRMLGLEFSENFNFPYTSQSVREFWKRWHMTLSSWLRDYLFLPLAYSFSRKLSRESYLGFSSDRWIYLFATLITFLLCGLWHGAAITFIAWGLIHGTMMTAEQFGLGRLMKKVPAIFRHSYLILFLLMTWILFRSPSFRDAFLFYGAMFGTTGTRTDLSQVLAFPGSQAWLVFLVATLGSTPIARLVQNIPVHLQHQRSEWVQALAVHFSNVLAILGLIVLIVLCTVFMVAGTSIPFVYFKF